MKFQTEAELVGTLTNTLRSSFSRDQVQIFKEVSLGFGIADLVLCNLVDIPKKRKNKKTCLNFKDINTYSLVDKEECISIDEIVSITGCSKIEVKKSLKKLEKNKYVKIKDSKVYKFKNYSLLFKDNFAIEAKLKDWKRAVQQAYRYRWFAEYSYVVLDSHYSKSAINNLDIFEKYNVGLATINPEGNLVRYFNPKRQQPFDLKMQILFSEKIKNI
mgnify:CR=1 FL=1|tara:strand:+ start:1101 stop:1748 length:648 start_codon:yes stop_codon:yes gene_type:complete